MNDVTEPREFASAERDRGLPLVLKILWTCWAGLAIVSIAVWLLVSTAAAVPFWPVGLALPGMLLWLVTMATMYVRNGSR